MRKKIILIFIIFSIVIAYSSTVFADITANDVYYEGKGYGYIDGRDAALINNLKNSFLEYYRVMPSKTEVLEKYKDYLEDKKQYSDSFYDGYREGFKEGYNAYIANGPGSGGTQPVNFNTNFGTIFGKILGEIAGIKDYEAGKSPNYLRELPKDAEITSTFDLSILPAADRTSFIKAFKDNFMQGYEEAYYNAHYGLIRDSIDNGRDDGAYFGEILGAMFGAKDYYEGRTLDYKRNLPSDSIIRTEYSLNRDNEEYIKGFLDGFKNAYRESYITSFREARNYVKELEVEYAYDNGYDVGEVRGTEQARIDYISKRTNNWLRSRPSASTIIYDYRLMYQNQGYLDNFVYGFWDGYSKGYTETYKELSQKDAMNKVTSIIVPIEGGIVRSSDNSMFVQIEKGTYYRENIVNIEVVSNSTKFDSKYIIASNSYKVYVVNPSGEYNPDKKVLISFEYYGDNNAGIYIQKNGRWVYLESKINNNSIITSIDPSLISGDGNVFTVLVDKEFVNFYDIRGHWAKDEIDTLVRKGIINGYPDKTFRPDKYITRAEFIVLLSRAYEWELPSDLSNISIFKDRSSFSVFNEKQISYALSHGYINGYPDNYFRPNNYISYKEVEVIMRRILMNDNFTWDAIANKIMYDKKVRLDSFDSLDNKITRAEFSYLLHELINEI